MIINHPTISQNGVIRPTNVEVNLDRLTENYEAIAGTVLPAKIMVILKANAYGHGLVPVAQHIVSLGAAYLGVAFLEGFETEVGDMAVPHGRLIYPLELH